MGNRQTTVWSIYISHNERPEKNYILLSTATLHNKRNSSTLPAPFSSRLLCYAWTNGCFIHLQEGNYRNGKIIQYFMDQFNLIAQVSEPNVQNMHISSSTRDSAHLDYILSRKKWINSIKNSRSCNSFQIFNSDHRIVCCKYLISYRKCKAPAKDPMKRIDWRKVVADDEIRRT